MNRLHGGVHFPMGTSMNNIPMPPMMDMSMLGHVDPWMASHSISSNSSSSGSSQGSYDHDAHFRGRGPSKSSDAPRMPYPKNFVPTIHHVICGRGKKSYGHCGNKNFLTIVTGHIEEYSKATTKQEKSDIVQAIVDTVEDKGGFIRLDPKTGLFYNAEEGAGREKTSQALRDCLNHKYKSSKDIKRKNRKQKRLAKQAVHEHVAQKRPSLTTSAADGGSATKKDKRVSKSRGKKEVPVAKYMAEEAMSMPLLSGVHGDEMRPYVVPPRTVSSTSVDMAAAAAAVSAPMPVSPAPLVMDEWAPVPVGCASQKMMSQELEPLPFRTYEVERLPEMMAPFDFMV